MLSWALKKVFGTAHDREVKRCRPRVEAINALEARIKKLSDEDLKAKTAEFREKLDAGAKLDDLLVEAFAVCREAGRRVLKMRHFDVQLIGGMILHDGKIAEMRTGEGKTLVATLPVYLNALERKGVHVVTVNDYLARRDSEWMGRLYGALGLTTGVVVHSQSDGDKKHAYKCDVTYGQNNEFGFDYLRDNMKFSALDYVQRELNFAIVDEVDSILIDEARTPLIISGNQEASSHKYEQINSIIPRLKKDEHYQVDEKGHSVSMTDDGVDQAQKLLGLKNLYDPVNIETLHILNQCLRAHALYKRDVNYLVTEAGEVLIIDEFTGRVLPGRRWSDGLHQAVEAKEGVRIKEESRTMATITFQNLFRIYKKLGGMTGTADTESAEFWSTYKLKVVSIPTNQPAVRKDEDDVVYKTEREKFTAVIKEILEKHDAGQPVLVGTTNVEKSAAIARILKKRGIPHAVLNAKHHEKEAYVIAQAGKKGAITVSTNMAGRGTDIILGGNAEMLAKLDFREQGRDPDAEREAFDALVAKYEETCSKERAEILRTHQRCVKCGKSCGLDEQKCTDTACGGKLEAAGGLHILGTERHESRRIDNQLRGRAGRQGDPGSSRFFLSLEDDLMRIFAGDRVKTLMERMGMPDDEPIVHPWVTKSIGDAQEKVEARNFDIRKNLLEYDDVMNEQRKTVYKLRQQLLLGVYTPEKLDEEGKPTGKMREIKPLERIAEEVKPALEEMMLHHAAPLDPEKEGEPAPRATKLEEVKRIRDLEALQADLYQFYGARVDMKDGDEKRPKKVMKRLLEEIPRSLTEQRERMLDLIDAIVGALLAECCPAQKPPEDWDWKELRRGFVEHFGAKPKDHEGVQVLEELAQNLYKQAEEAAFAKEKELGTELFLRVFRHFYLEEIDRAWVDHLTAMEHLRDGIGLRGYGQRDPKQEYKKEGYDLFVNMMQATSSSVVTKVFKVQVRKQDVEELERQDAARHAAQEQRMQMSHGGEVNPGSDEDEAPAPRPARRQQQVELVQPQRRGPSIARNDPCPCGSGQPFRKCHGAALEDDSAG